MAWITPKTDWTSADYFNAADYNRIKNNLAYMSNIADSLYNVELDGIILPDATYSDRPSAYKLNQIEIRFQSLADLLGYDYGTGVTFVDFGPSINWTELNRIESASIEMHDRLVTQASALPMFAFTLGLQGHTPFRF